MEPINLFNHNNTLFDIDSIKIWLSNGSHPDSIKVHGCPYYGYTPLMLVCNYTKQSNTCNVAKLLISHNDNVNYNISGTTPLSVIIYSNRYDYYELLDGKIKNQNEKITTNKFRLWVINNYYNILILVSQ